MSEPIHIISLGAGVQSSTMALMAWRQARLRQCRLLACLLTLAQTTLMQGVPYLHSSLQPITEVDFSTEE